MTPRTSRLLVLAALAAGIALRLWEALESSLWLDELHSIVHAWKPKDVAGVLEHVHWDFHAPLFFVGLHFVRPERAELARLLPIFSSLLILVPLLAFARRSRLSPWAPPLATALFALLPFQIQCATELRPYAWLALASATACWAAFSSSGRPATRFAAFALAVAFGMLTHYLMALVVALIGAVRLLFLLPRLRRAAGEPPPLGLPWLILAGAIGASAFLPWLFKYMSWAYETPEDLVPGDAAQRVVTIANWIDLAQAPLKSLVPQIRALGDPWTSLAALGAILLLGGFGGAGLHWLRRGRSPRDLPRADRSVAMAVTFAILALGVVCATSIWSWARVSVRYLWIAAWLWPLIACELVAAIRSPRARVAAVTLMLLGAGVAGVAHAGGRTREDVRSAVQYARLAGAFLAIEDPAHPPIYTALLSQPPRFEHGLPYLAYGAGLDWVEPKDLPRPGEPGFERPVIVVTRRWQNLDHAMVDNPATLAAYPVDRIRDGRMRMSYCDWADTMTVQVFRPPPKPESR